MTFYRGDISPTFDLLPLTLVGTIRSEIQRWKNEQKKLSQKVLTSTLCNSSPSYGQALFQGWCLGASGDFQPVFLWRVKHFTDVQCRQFCSKYPLVDWVSKKLCPALVMTCLRWPCFSGIATFLSVLPNFSKKCETWNSWWLHVMLVNFMWLDLQFSRQRSQFDTSIAYVWNSVSYFEESVTIV